MLTITLFRHAKAVRDDGVPRDIDRPLAPRGLDNARLMGDWLAGQELVPDLVIASTSARTRETASLALARLPREPGARFEQVLYLATTRTLLGVIQRASAQHRHLMLVGHNPGLHELALMLAGRGDGPAHARLAEKLPTGAIVVLRFDVEAWTGVTAGHGELMHFVTPRGIEGAA